MNIFCLNYDIFGFRSYMSPLSSTITIVPMFMVLLAVLIPVSMEGLLSCFTRPGSYIGKPLKLDRDTLAMFHMTLRNICMPFFFF